MLYSQNCVCEEGGWFGGVRWADNRSMQIEGLRQVGNVQCVR